MWNTDRRTDTDSQHMTSLTPRILVFPCIEWRTSEIYCVVITVSRHMESYALISHLFNIQVYFVVYSRLTQNSVLKHETIP